MLISMATIKVMVINFNSINITIQRLILILNRRYLCKYVVVFTPHVVYGGMRLCTCRIKLLWSLCIRLTNSLTALYRGVV